MTSPTLLAERQPSVVTSLSSRRKVAEPAMTRMLREARGLLVKELADLIGKSSSYVSKVESGGAELTGEPLEEYARALEVDPALLCHSYEPVGLEGAHFRSHTTTPMKVRKQAVAEANWAHLHLEVFLGLAEYEHPRSLPQVDADLLEGGGATAAAIVRRMWRVNGRIANMTKLLESCGVFVVNFPHDHRHVDAVTVRGENLTAVVMIRDDLPPERRRWTLAHELGHLVMDATSNLEPKVLEARADAFAAEFLIPFDDIEAELQGITPRQIDHLEGLRRYWGVSIPALVRTAYKGGCITEHQYRYWFKTLNSQGRLRGTRDTIWVEEPQAAARLLAVLKDEGYSMQELVGMTKTGRSDLERHLGEQWPWPKPPSLAPVST